MSDTLLDRLDQAAAFLAAHHCDAKAIDDAKAEIVRLRAELASAVAAERERCADFVLKAASDAAKTLHHLHQLKTLTRAQTAEWESLIETYTNLAAAIRKGG